MGADKVINYDENSLDKAFIRENFYILKNSKGSGLWLWKPYLILKTLNDLDYGDKVLYCDAGMFPINKLKFLFDLSNKSKDIVLFQVHEKMNKNWTKKDCFSHMGCDSDLFYNKEQVCGAPQLYTKTENSVDFLKQVLHFCKSSAILDPLDYSKEEKDFIQHRHDQSILTNLAIKHKIEIFRDPSQFGNNFSRTNSNYPQIFNLHRGNINNAF
jgi:hypothetical protein